MDDGESDSELFDQFQAPNKPSKKSQHIRFSNSNSPSPNSSPTVANDLEQELERLKSENKELRERLSSVESSDSIRVVLPKDLVLDRTQQQLVKDCEADLSYKLLTSNKVSMIPITMEELFMIDKTPSVTEQTDNAVAYDCVAEGQMTGDDVVDAPKNMAPRPKRPKMLCFNCSGSHRITECKEPKNPVTIARNKKEFLLEKGNRQSSSVRYHDEQLNGGPKYKPGTLSDGLCEALGLRRNDLPEWIYRMRRLGNVRGYPPGHLKNAIINKKTLTFHNEQGDYAASGDDESEEPVQLDDKKIYYYPGFNVPASRHTYDRERGSYRCPNFREYVQQLGNELQLRKTMQMQEKRAANKTSEPPKKRRRPQQQDVEMVDMELSDDNETPASPPPAPGTEPFEVPVPVIPPWETPAESLEALSPSELEAERAKLVAALAETEEKSDELNGTITLDESPIEPVVVTLDESPSVAGTSIRRQGSSRSLRVDLGTPTLPSQSSKPDLDEFSKGVQPFECSEELPKGKSGSLQRLKKVIARIRGKKKDDSNSTKFERASSNRKTR